MAINSNVHAEPTPIAGIRYVYPAEGARLTRIEGSLPLDCAGIPVPITEGDVDAVSGSSFPYDVVGRGLYQALRTNPECTYANRYARLLKESYPHYVSELASEIVMLDRKDVEVPYLDRKVNYLKIFAHIEPENHQIPRAIGMTLLDKGLRLSALHLTTVTVFRAETFLRRSLSLAPDDVSARHHLGEVCYLIGKYDEAIDCWRSICEELSVPEQERLERRIKGVEEGSIPRVPPIDYLQAVGVALECQQRGEDEDAAAILRDILDDDHFCREFPFPELYYLLALSCERLGTPRLAVQYLTEALRLNPDYEEARDAMTRLGA
ncbi:MAG TPA: hypothetical protein VI389_08080 [Geobacteraceae bacterium]